MPLIICPKCKAKISDRAVKCVKCGYELSNLVKCVKCGALHDKDVLECPECGYNKIKEEERKAIEKKLQEEQIKQEEKTKEEKKVKEKSTDNKINTRTPKKKIVVILSIIFIVVAFAYLLPTVIIPSIKYHKATSLSNAKEYDEAITLFAELNDYKDSESQIYQCKYNKAIDLFELKEYDEAINIFSSIKSYEDSLEQIKNCRYNKALGFLEVKEYDEAKKIFYSLGKYKDSLNKVLEIEMIYIKDASVGDIVNFGRYNGNIEWMVLDKKDNKILVISNYVLDCQPYNTTKTDITWENSSIRKWLNEDFISEAFNESELAQIVMTNVIADRNPSFNTNPGNNTSDKVFLLSINEVNKYIKNNEYRQGVPIGNAISNVAVGNDGHCMWWLRTPGDYQSAATFINVFGIVFSYGFNVNETCLGVRPALWISLD